MSFPTLVRWSGLAALVGGVLLIVRNVLDFIFLPQGQPFSARVMTGAWNIVAPLTVAGFMLLVSGLIGLYVHQSSRAGVLGLVAFLVAFVGTMLYSASLFAGYLYAPDLALLAPSVLDNPSGRLRFLGFLIPFLLIYPGWLLFGLASIRAKVFPRFAAVLLMLSLPLIILQGVVYLPVVGDIAFALGPTWMGFALWTGHVGSTGPTIGEAA